MTNVFVIQWYRFVENLVPNLVKKSLLLAFINSAFAPIRSKYEVFLQWKAESEYKVRHNGQICYLQKLLNDQFDNYHRRIIVENTPPKETLNVYYPQENRPIYAYNERPFFMYNEDDYFNEFDFTVLIPEEIVPNTHLIRNEVEFYKLYSKNYQIITL